LVFSDYSVNDFNLNCVCVLVVWFGLKDINGGNNFNLTDFLVTCCMAWNGGWSDEYLFSYWFDCQNDGILY